MAKNSKIEWTHHTFNPWRGCEKIAPGCKFCYAERQSKRNPQVLGEWGPDGTRIVAAESAWCEPDKWDREAKLAGERHRVFCASIADVFEDWQGPMSDHRGRELFVDDDNWFATGQEHFPTCRPLAMADVRGRLFADLIDRLTWLDWLLLTKRPENIPTLIPKVICGRCRGTGFAIKGDGYSGENCKACCGDGVYGYRRNVWLGTSIATQADADRNGPLLVQCSELAPILFLSMEPLIERVKLDPFLLKNIDWLIVGGESHLQRDQARPCDLTWIADVVDQSQAAGVPVYVKQLGSNPCRAGFKYRTRDDKGGDWMEWPNALRVREFPTV